MAVILTFFFAHWFLSLFFHTFFLHRFASHQMYTTSKNWERVFYLSTWVTQGSSYLVPRAYGVMHRMHHAYSDTEKDPHSPHFFKDVMGMMMHTRNIYNAFVTRKNMPEPQFTHEYLPIWEKLDRFADNIWTRLFFAALYTTIYIVFAPNMWWFLLLPIHFLMGPIQGAIVNWCGHKYGYANYKNDDHSKNSEPWGIFLLGELFQNNHHKQGTNPNFARKWFELDPTYQIMKLLNLTGIIRLNKLVVEVEEPIKEIGDVKKERVA